MVEPRFTSSQPFRGGTACVTLEVNGERRYGHLAPDGSWAIQPRFAVAYPFCEGLAVAPEDRQRFGWIDATGARAIAPRFDFGECIAEDRAGFVARSQDPTGRTLVRRGLLDRGGQVVLHAVHEEVHAVQEGRAAVKRDGRWGYVDPTGAWGVPPTYRQAGPFRGGRARVQPVEGEARFIDPSGGRAE